MVVVSHVASGNEGWWLMSVRGWAEPVTYQGAVGRFTGTGAALGGMLALAAGMGIGRFVYTPILPDMAAALGLSKSGAGAIASANFLGYLVGALLAAARLPGGRRVWFLSGLTASALTTGAMAMPGSMPAFLLIRFVGGVASAFVLVLGSALVLDRLAVTRRTGWAALHFAGVGAGIAASSVLVDALYAIGANWWAMWLASGALSALAVPFAVWLVQETASPSQAYPPKTIRELPPRGLRVLTLCHGLFGFGYAITATFLVAVVRATTQARALEAVVWLVLGVAATPSTAGWSRIATSVGPLRAYAFACLIAAVGVAAGGLWPSSAGALTAAVLLGGTFMGITALGFAAARAMGPQQQRRSFSMITVAFGLGQTAGPTVAGVMLDQTHSFVGASVLAAAAVAVAAVVATRLAVALDRSAVSST
jgi:predicted MFS family arabinose efflux permease